MKLLTMICTVVLTACAPQNRGPFVQTVIVDNSRLELLEATLQYQQQQLTALIAQQEEQARVIDLLESGANYQLLLAQLQVIDARLVEALETITDLQEQIDAERVRQNSPKHRHSK